MGLFPVPSTASLLEAGRNLRVKALDGGLADLTRMPRTQVGAGQLRTLYRYDPVPDVPQLGPPLLLVPPLGAPDFAYDLRKGCSLVEHLVEAGRIVYLVDYGPIALDDRRLGMEFWVDEIVPWAVEETLEHDGSAALDLFGWSMGGVFSLLAMAARPELPVRSVVAIGSPIDVSAVPIVAPLRPIAQVTGGRLLSAVYRSVGSFPAPVVQWAFHLTTVDRLITKPLTVLSKLDDRDCLEQIEAVDHLMNNMHGYPGRAFGQIYHLMFRSNDLAGGGIDLGGRRISLADVAVPVLVVGGLNDVIAPLPAVRCAVDVLTGAPLVRFESAPGGHLGVLTGRQARATTWRYVDEFLDGQLE